jgi:two-component system NarL family response regulator
MWNYIVDSKAIRVLLVDDHPVVRDGLAALFSTQPDITVVGEAANGEEALTLFHQLRPDMTLVDLHLPTMSGVELIRRLRADSTQARILVLTTYDLDEEIHLALQAGAHAYLLKNTPSRTLLEAVRNVRAGQRCFAPEIAARLAEYWPRPELTSRELEVLHRIAGGCKNKEIAADLAISEDTVKTHVKAIMGKLHASDRTQAVTIALRRGIISL